MSTPQRTPLRTKSVAALMAALQLLPMTLPLAAHAQQVLTPEEAAGKQVWAIVLAWLGRCQ